jgi:hypothetical protein
MNIKQELEKISQMTQTEMASLYRNAPVGHPYFSYDYPELLNAFKERFKALGGMTPSVSKSIGWK